MNRFDLPNLGIGLGLRTRHYADILEATHDLLLLLSCALQRFGRHRDARSGGALRLFAAAVMRERVAGPADRD